MTAIRISHRLLLLQSAVLAGALLSPAPVSAMPEAKAETASGGGSADATNSAEDIVVYAPIADAQALALAEQRSATNLVAIIAADSIGRFPDQNSAAALARLPAVAVQRDQGQERYIQVRGAPNRWTSVSFDGVPVVGVDEGGATRAFRFDAVPSVILSSIAVNKSLTPDLPAEAIVAQIDMRTFSPFEREGFDLSADVGLGWMELGGGEQRQASVRTSWSGDRWGFMLAGSHYRRNQITDNRESAYDANGLPTVLDYRSYLLVRENNGASAGVEFRPTDGHSLFVKGVWSEFRDDEERNQYVFQLDRAASGTRGAVSGDLVGVPVRGTKSYSNYRNANWILTGGGNHAFAGQWSAGWRLNYTRVDNSSDLPIVLQNQQFNRLNRPSLTYDRSNVDLPIMQLFTTIPGATPGSFARGSATRGLNQAGFDLNIGLPLVSDIRAESWTAKVDVEGPAGPVTLRAGLQYDDRIIRGNVLASAVTITIPPPGLPAGNYVTTRP